MLEVPAELREQMGGLPFKPRAPGTELARTMQVPVLNLNQGKTAPLGDDSIAKAVAAQPVRWEHGRRGARAAAPARLSCSGWVVPAICVIVGAGSGHSSNQLRRASPEANRGLGAGGACMGDAGGVVEMARIRRSYLLACLRVCSRC